MHTALSLFCMDLFQIAGWENGIRWENIGKLSGKLELNWMAMNEEIK